MRRGAPELLGCAKLTPSYPGSRLSTQAGLPPVGKAATILSMGSAVGLRGFFGRRTVSSTEVRDNLWTNDVDHLAYSDETEKYQAAVLEQYKLYVEMTDRIGARRAATNSFFLLVNSSIFAVLGALQVRSFRESSAVLVVSVAALILQCGAWYWILRSYQQLSSAKFRVIGALEERLPCSPWFRAEWTAVGNGQDRSRYWPITRIEQWVPALFSVAYFILLIVILAR